MLGLTNGKTPAPHAPDYVLLATVGTLVALGLVMVYSASFVEGLMLHDSQFYYLLRQLTGATIGVVCLLVIQRLDYHIWRRFSVHLMAVALVLLVLVLVLPETMTMVNGSRSWIRFGGGLFSVQPSEIVKLAIIIYFADWLSRRGSKLSNVTYGLIPFAVMLGLVCGLIMLEPDLGTTFIVLVIASAIYFAAGANLLHLLGAGALGVGACWALLNVFQYQNGRIAAFVDPWKYYNSYGYQPVHALYALGSGGPLGEGLGQARQKFQWLPQAHTDTIFAIVGEELGLIGTILVLAAFGFIAYRGYRIACRLNDPFASLVAVGITSWLVWQAFTNIAVTTSMVPFTGITLPFLSYGSSSLIMCLVATGILINLSRYTVTQQQEEVTHHGFWFQRSPALAFVQRTRKAVAPLSLWWRHGRSRLSGIDRRRSPAGSRHRPAVTARSGARQRPVATAQRAELCRSRTNRRQRPAARS
ncbi:MAG: putative lipid II flippase FtsW [Chloroflexaceae bacterium]|nr:putative lipid II flippase FtsW [Chloroflexaceae bacterium]